jgi:hypothetical protein
MFTVLILVCTTATPDDLSKECKVFSSGAVHATEEACMLDARMGIDFAERSGLYLKDWKCYTWGKNI